MTQPILNKDIYSATKGVAVVADTPFAVCRALNTDTAESVTVTWADGGTSALYLIAGMNPAMVTNVASGFSGTIIAIY